MMVGILTEKPSAARNFAKALGGMSGTYNGEQYMITASRGHLFEFAQPQEMVPADKAARYKSWNVAYLPWNETDFSWKRAKKKGVSDTLSDIKKTLSRCDEVVIATDSDPTGEGELLAWEILDELKFRPKKWSRMDFLDESVSSIQKAFKERRPIKNMLSDMDYVKANYRSQFDFLTMQFTRIATACGDGKSVLRQGRLKSAMVKIVGDQLKLVSEYKKIPFYQNRFRDENGVVYSDPKEPLFPKKEDVPKQYHASSVVCDKKEMKKTAPPKYLDLAALSSRLAPKGYFAKSVLSTYQKMYEDQVVSYPRTEDSFVSPEQFKELLPKVDAIAKVVGIDPKLLTHRTPRPGHVKTGGAHGANRPGMNVPKSLKDLESYGKAAPAIYELLARSYLASLAEDYEYESQKGHVADYPSFVGSVSVPKKMGWKLVMDDDEETDGNGKGLGTRAEPFIHEGFPPKPAAPTMKWLMKQLEQHDVGTGATRTSIYADVTDASAKYPLLHESRGKLTMTEFGEMSYRLLPGTHIGDLSMTEQLQKDMRDIAAGKADPTKLLIRMRQLVAEDAIVMKQNGMAMRKDMGKKMADEQREYYEGAWNGQQIRFNRNWCGHRFTDEECEKLLRGEDLVVMGVQGRNGPYNAVGKLMEQSYNGHDFIGFSRTGYANDAGQKKKEGDVPDRWCGHTFTKEEKEMLQTGLHVDLMQCIGKSGKPFDTTVRFGDDGSGKKKIIPKFAKEF